MKAKRLWLIPIGIGAVALFVIVGGGLVQWLWNWLVPDIFNGPTITFWQAFGLLALSRILVGGWGGGSKSSHSSFRGRFSDRLADRVADRLEHMTPEERERFRQRVRERTGVDPAVSNP